MPPFWGFALLLPSGLGQRMTEFLRLRCNVAGSNLDILSEFAFCK
jgi:hypothetical protein